MQKQFLTVKVSGSVYCGEGIENLTLFWLHQGPPTSPHRLAKGLGRWGQRGDTQTHFLLKIDNTHYLDSSSMFGGSRIGLVSHKHKKRLCSLKDGVHITRCTLTPCVGSVPTQRHHSALSNQSSYTGERMERKWSGMDRTWTRDPLDHGSPPSAFFFSCCKNPIK
jgi:hypothetical protein